MVLIFGSRVRYQSMHRMRLMAISSRISVGKAAGSWDSLTENEYLPSSDWMIDVILSMCVFFFNDACVFDLVIDFGSKFQFQMSLFQERLELYGRRSYYKRLELCC